MIKYDPPIWLQSDDIARSVVHRFSNRVRGSYMFPVRARAQGSLCVSSQPLVALPRGPVGSPWRISFSTFKGKSRPSGMPTAAPGGVLYRSAASLLRNTRFCISRKRRYFSCFVVPFGATRAPAKHYTNRQMRAGRASHPWCGGYFGQKWAPNARHTTLRTAGVSQNRKKSSHV